MRRNNKEIHLTSYDELLGIGSEELTDTEKIIYAPLDMLHTFKNHPFKVRDDEKMQETTESILNYGVLVPGIARPRDEGGYELISGHRRKRGSEKAGKKEMPVIVRNYTDDEATIIMVDANIQREDISYSEKAKAYKMKFEAMKHQGSRGSNTYKEVGEAAGDNIKMVQRYIRLAELIPSLLDMVDEKKLGFICGVDISYLTEEEQTWVFNILSRKKINISIVQSSKLKDYSKNGKLTEEMVRLILMDHKPKERKVVIKSDEISRFFPAEYSNEDIEKVIYQLLEQWKKEGQL